MKFYSFRVWFCGQELGVTMDPGTYQEFDSLNRHKAEELRRQFLYFVKGACPELHFLDKDDLKAI